MTVAPGEKIGVTVLGAEGPAGEQLMGRLDGHPWFEVRAAMASHRGAKPAGGERLVLSMLDATVAAAVEQEFARAGAVVISHSGAHRAAPDVPVLIPEVNADHLALVERQRRDRRWTGAIVATPNCSTAGVALALGPLHRAFGLERAVVTSMQALSGAGRPGVPALDIVGNVIPLSPGEEESVEGETRRLLGQLQGLVVTEAAIGLSVQACRVPVLEGHLQTISAGFRRKAAPEDVSAVLEGVRLPPDIASLPSAPPRPVVLRGQPDRPQPRLDAGESGGMAVVVGRVRPCPVLDVRFTVVTNNLVRGAAGGVILAAELMVSRGFFG